MPETLAKEIAGMCIRLANWIVRQPGQKLPTFKLKAADRLGTDRSSIDDNGVGSNR